MRKVFCAGIIWGTVGSGAVAAGECSSNAKMVPIQGKISNNGLKSDPGGSETLGVAALAIDPKGSSKTKMRCGLHGIGLVAANGEISFTDILVCDDSVPEGDAELIHSQAVFSTSGQGWFQLCDSTNPLRGIYGPFVETSTLISGRGRFSENGGGSITAYGIISCSGTVDMAFSGNLCIKP